jgi:hypothetical protein
MICTKSIGGEDPILEKKGKCNSNRGREEKENIFFFFLFGSKSFPQTGQRAQSCIVDNRGR